MRIDPATLSLNMLDKVQNATPSALSLQNGEAKPQGAKTFGQALMGALADVNAAQSRAGDLNTRFAAGEAVDVHEVMVASQEAGVMLNLALQVRNKVVEGYQEIMRTNV